MGLVLRRRRTLPILETERMVLRLPEMRDYANWSTLRRDGEDFLRPWEPAWSPDHFSKRSFRARVYWASRARDDGRALSMFLISRHNEELLGAITLDNIRRGPAQTGSVGYWIGPNHSRQGYMSEALLAVADHAFSVLDLSRIEAACLPENTPSRGLLQRSGFVEEGRAESYLQINGQWRDHVLYSKLRLDRRQYRHMESEF